jgi:large subunit ribosomal protein L10
VPTQAKAETIQELKRRLQDARTAVVTEYRGLTVQQLSELRKQLRGVAAEYRVVKNRLARLAIADSSLSGLRPHLTGPVGVVIGRRDPVAVAKALSTFIRTTPALQVKVGVIDGQVVDREALRAVADLPSQEILRGQLVGAIQGPLAQLVGLLLAPHRELAYVLAERAKAGPADTGIAEPVPVEAAVAASAEASAVVSAGAGATGAVGAASGGPGESGPGDPVDESDRGGGG